MSDCLFCKIINKEIDADIIYEDEQCLAFNDISPKAPTHILLIPKKHIATLNNANDSTLLGHLLTTTKDLAKEKGVSEDGYRVVINCNDHGGQEVYHLHLHLLAGRNLNWPPG